MVDKIKKFINSYQLKPFLIALILIIILNHPFALLACHIADISKKEPLIYGMIQIAVPLISLVVWSFIFFNHIRSKRYFLLTGRSYAFDIGHYNRTFQELVEYFRDAEPHRLDTSIFPKQSWQTTKGLIFGMDQKQLISLPSDTEGNIAIFGPPGSGKTAGLAIINAMQFDGSVLAVDIKGDIFNYVSSHSNRNIIRFSPDHPDALNVSCRFDPLIGFSDLTVTDQKLYLENMATILIPDAGGNEGNYFTSRARKLFQGIAHLLFFENPDTSFPDIVHAILQGNVFDWVKQALESDCTTSKELLSSFYGNSEKNVSGAYDALSSALVSFSNPVLDELLQRSSDSISIDALEEGSDIYLQISQEHLDAYAPLFTLLIQSFSTAFTRRPDSSSGIKNRPILMLLDEFPQLTFSYRMINTNLSTLRSKSVICMLIQQNLSQLEYRYQPIGVRSIVGNCNYQIILGSNDIESSKHFSELFGNKKVLRVGNSLTESNQTSSGKSVQEAEEKVFPPEHFGDLPASGKMILYFKGKYCECEKLNCYID